MTNSQALTSLSTFAVFLALASPVDAARVLSHFDLDSLAYMSEAVVRIEVGPSTLVKNEGYTDCRVHEVRALHVFKGPIKVGQTLRVTGLDTYYHAPGLPNRADSWDPMQQGESLYLFLVENGKTGYSKYRLTDAEWTVIESGARLLAGQRVYSFVQPSSLPLKGTPSRAPMFHSHAVLTVALVPGAPVLTRKGFEERLSRSFQTAVQVAELLAAPAAARRFEEYSTVLRGRADVLRKEMASDDHVGALVAAELVQLATGPEQILALRSGASSRVLAVLDNALLRWPGTLIERIRNKKVPMRRRMEWARVLSEGLWIRERYELARRASKDLTNRVAQLAIENLGTELIYPLLRGVVSIGDHLKADQAALARDVYPALRVLSEAYPAAEPSDQYHIAEVLQQIGGEPYRKLLPEAGPFLTLIEPAPDLADSMASGELRVRCSFRNQLTTRSELTIVLKAQGELEIELPVESELSELTNNFGSGWEIGASIPQRVSPGRYRVFLRARQGKRRVGDGLGFEINLPRR